jgi:hypothetical protein
MFSGRYSYAFASGFSTALNARCTRQPEHEAANNPRIGRPFLWLAHAALDGFTVALDEFSKRVGRRQRDQITGNEELIIQACGRELNLCLIFVATKETPTGGTKISCA